MTVTSTATDTPARRSPGFGDGASAVLRGAKMIAANPRLWPYAMAPVVIALLACALGIWAGAALLDSMLAPYFQGWDQGWRWVVRGAAYVLGYLTIVVSAGMLSKIVVLPVAAGPFNEMLSEQVEALVTGRPPPSTSLRGFLHDLGPTLWRSLTTGLYTGALGILTLPLLLLPVVGWILILAIDSYLEAFNMLDVTLGRKRRSLTEKRAWVARRRTGAYGFAAAILLGNLIPLGIIFVVPAAAAGGTLLVIEDPEP